MKNRISVEEIRKLLPHGKDCFLYLPDHLKHVVLLSTEGDYPVIHALFYPPKEHFKGHFPGKPVYPGVIQLEALMQLGAILVLASADEPKIIYPVEIKKARFREAITPDTLFAILHVELTKLSKRGGEGFGAVYKCEKGESNYDKDKKPATEATFTFLFGST